MEEKFYNMTLADGTELRNLRLNGDNYISSVEIFESTFEGKLSEVTITSGDEVEVLHDVELIQISHYSDGWYFVLKEMTPAEKRERDREEEITNLQLAIADVYEMIIP